MRETPKIIPKTKLLGRSSMLRITIYRFLEMIVTLWIVATCIFFLLRLVPGGPFDSDKVWSPDIQAAINQKYGLDKPLTAQYTNWISGLAHGDLKESFQYQGQDVAELIWVSLPYSLIVGAGALILAVFMGVGLGVLSAWKKGTWIDFSSSFLAIAGVSLPPYLIATVLILVFSIHLRILPVALVEGPSSYVLPIITLGIRPAATIARLVRAGLLEILNTDFIRTARSLGVSPLKILLKHALKNALIPVLTILGPLAAAILTGSFVIEYVFQIPGVGKHFVTSIINRDYPVTMGITLLYGVFLLVANFIVDLSYSWADPRIKLK